MSRRKKGRSNSELIHRLRVNAPVYFYRGGSLLMAFVDTVSSTFTEDLKWIPCTEPNGKHHLLALDEIYLTESEAKQSE